MCALIQGIVCFVMIDMVISLKLLFPVQESRYESSGRSDSQKSLRRVLSSLANAKLYLTSGDRRSVDPFELTKAKNLLDVISRRRHKGHLREKEEKVGARVHGSQPVPLDPDNQMIDINDHQQLVEKELEDTMSKHSSALLHNAWVQKRGQNDFLVLEDEEKDPFVTVIPNNIYYNIEKNCVNWMDDCSLQGIRQKLLNRVRGPY